MEYNGNVDAVSRHILRDRIMERESETYEEYIAKKVMAVSGENSGNVKNAHNKSGSDKGGSASERYRNWMIGLFISFIPVLALPLSHIYMRESVAKALYEAFCSAEIIFIGISLGIAVLNDFIAQKTAKNSQGWVLLMILLLILGAMIYGVAIITENLGDSKDNTDGFNYPLAFGINIAFLAIVFLIGTARYIKEIKRERL